MSEITLSHHVEQAFAALPASLNACLSNTPQTYHFFPADVVHLTCQRLSINVGQLGLALLPLATAFAVTPVSQFNVGAVAFDSEGNAYLGANFEFTDTHIGQTIHAEQSAIANAWACGAKDLALLVINYPPCGHCRQFINEVNLAPDFRIQLPDREAKPLSYYLPDAFGPADLAITARILQQPSLDLDNHVGDLFSTAVAACQSSHAPYSHSHSGIALQYADGDVVTGRYAENAAFNPSLPTLQMALNTRRMHGKDWKNIEQAVMVETPTTLSQRGQAQMLLTTWGIDLHYRQIDLM